jgi:hypothetical protein
MLCFCLSKSIVLCFPNINILISTLTQISVRDQKVLLMIITYDMLIKFFQFRDLFNSARGCPGKTFCNLSELESLMVLYHCMVVNVVKYVSVCRVLHSISHCQCMNWNHGLETHLYMCSIAQQQA